MRKKYFILFSDIFTNANYFYCRSRIHSRVTFYFARIISDSYNQLDFQALKITIKNY